MILLDTNVLIYERPLLPQWRMTAPPSRGQPRGDCEGDEDPATVADRVRSWGVDILDVPTAAAPECARAYRDYRHQRRSQSGKSAPSMPLPDFFIGAHATTMSWELATADRGRFDTYFPAVSLTMPP